LLPILLQDTVPCRYMQPFTLPEKFTAQSPTLRLAWRGFAPMCYWPNSWLGGLKHPLKYV